MSQRQRQSSTMSSSSSSSSSSSGSSSSWFNQFAIVDPATLNLSSIASKVSSFVGGVDGALDEATSGANSRSSRRVDEPPRATRSSSNRGTPASAFWQDDRQTANKRSLSSSGFVAPPHPTNGVSSSSAGFEEVEDLDAFQSLSLSQPHEESEREIRDLRNELNRVQAELSDQLRTRDKYIQTLEAQLVSLRESTSPKSQEAEKAALLKEQLAKAVSHLKTVVEENRNLSAKLQEADAVESELRNEIETITQRFEQQPVASISEALESLRNECQFLKSHVSAVEQTLEEATEREIELESRLAKAEAEKSELSGREASLVQTVTELMNQIEQQSSRSFDETSLKESLTLAQTEIERLKSEVAAASEESSQLRKEKAELLDARNDISLQIRAVKQEAGSLREAAGDSLLEEERLRRISDLEVQVQDLAAENSALAYDLELSQKAHAEIAERLQARTQLFESSAATARVALDEAEERVASLKAELDNRLTENRELQSYLEGKSDEVTSLTEMVRKLQSTILDLEGQRQQLSLDLEESRTALSDAARKAESSDETDRLSKQVAQLRSSLQEQRDQYLRDLDAARSQAERRMKELVDENLKLQQTLTATSSLQVDEQALLSCLAEIRGQTVPNTTQYPLPTAVVQQIDAIRSLIEELVAKCDRLENEKVSKSEGVKRSYENLIVDLNNEIEEKDQSLSALREELESVRASRDGISSDYSNLLEKVKNTLAPKLQEEMDQGVRLRAEVQTLNEELSNLREERSLLKAQIATLVSDGATLRDQHVADEKYRAEVESTSEALASALAELEKANRRLAALQLHLAESEEAATQDTLRAEATAREFRTRAETLEREREGWEAMATEAREMARHAEERAADWKAEAEAVREELAALSKYRERDAESLANLQSVIEEFQAVKQAEIDFALKGLQRQLEAVQAECAEFRKRAFQAEERLGELIREDIPAVDEIRAELQEKNVEIGKLRARVISLETYLSEAIRRSSSAENQVDRRLMTNLLVQFLSTPRGDAKRFEMLQVISSVLRLSDEDKVKVGLLRKVGPTGPSGVPSSGESFTDLWISFLIREASGNHGNRSNAASPQTGTVGGQFPPESSLGAPDSPATTAGTVVFGGSGVGGGGVDGASPRLSGSSSRRSSGFFGWTSNNNSSSSNENDKKK
ncbi:hypothetical protein DFJ73DRAFT_962080 [Zopfochytrium polystomum]|nr:hypothetical protein DFJ73DRAFT_962080 [Zopfochytrium polystomum]